MSLLGDFFKDLTGYDLPEPTGEITLPEVFVDHGPVGQRMVAEYSMRDFIDICEEVVDLRGQSQKTKAPPKPRFKQDPKFHNVVYGAYVPAVSREYFRQDMEFSQHLLSREGIDRLAHCQFVVRNLSEGESAGEYRDAGALYWKPPKDYIEISPWTDHYLFYILHECGHRFEAKAQPRDGQHFSHILGEMYRWAMKNDREFFVSDYAKTNPHEFWAEAFRSIFDGTGHYPGVFEFVRRAIKQYGSGLNL